MPISSFELILQAASLSIRAICSVTAPICFMGTVIFRENTKEQAMEITTQQIRDSGRAFRTVCVT